MIGLCYRSPSSLATNNDQLLDMFRAAVSQRNASHVMIFGDFNYPDIDYSQDMVAAGDDAASAKFFYTTKELFLQQCVLQPTRFRQNQQPSVLDYIFIDEENLIDDILGKSDHAVLKWDLQLRLQERKNTEKKLNFWKGDYGKINSKLSSINWNTSFENKSVEDMWTYFKQTVELLVNEHVPLKQEGRIKKKHWITKATLNQI